MGIISSGGEVVCDAKLGRTHKETSDMDYKTTKLPTMYQRTGPSMAASGS